MAEVGESKTEIREQKQVLELEREKMRRAIIRELKEAKEKAWLRKFELVDGSFQELGASKWRTWWWSYCCALVLKGWKPP